MIKKAYKITYDRVAEAIYMYINKGKIENTLVLNDNVIINVDVDGKLLGMDVLGFQTGLRRRIKNAFR